MRESNQASCRRLLLLLIAVGTPAACEKLSAPDSATGGARVAPASAATFNTTRLTEPDTGPWARIVEGEVGPGSLYALYIPRDWNGDAIYYVHGVRDPALSVTLDDTTFANIRDAISPQGFAIAFSSWSRNGEAWKDGSQRVHQLRGLLSAQLGRNPSRSFLLGSSMGSGIALRVLQTYPGQYDGALLTCGGVGGMILENQYAGDVRVLFDAFYPGALPGSAYWYPPNVPSVTLSQVQTAVQSNPTPLFLIASLVQTPLPSVPSGSPLNPSSTAFRTLVASLWTPLRQHSMLINDLSDVMHGHSFFDNSTTTYALGSNPLLPASQLQPLVDFANAHVARYTADPSAVNYSEHYFALTGDLPVPVLTLHNPYDPGMPIFHETALYAKAAAAGATEHLLQRLYPGYGHCAFPATAVAQNFADLVNWVTTGVKPAS